jgi:hypothetical protein
VFEFFVLFRSTMPENMLCYLCIYVHMYDHVHTYDMSSTNIYVTVEAGFENRYTVNLSDAKRFHSYNMCCVTELCKKQQNEPDECRHFCTSTRRRWRTTLATLATLGCCRQASTLADFHGKLSCRVTSWPSLKCSAFS